MEHQARQGQGTHPLRVQVHFGHDVDLADFDEAYTIQEPYTKRRRVLTGSFNWNNTAELVNDENMITLTDPGIVAGYEEEFRELWGEQAEAPGVHQGSLSRVLFSPEDRPRDAIIAAIGHRINAMAASP